MPSRASTRAGGLTNAVDGLTYSGAALSQPRPEQLNVTLQSQQRITAAPAQAAENPVAEAGLVQPAPAPEVRVSAASAGSPTSTLPPCDTTQSILYCVYTIQPGDTLSTIASEFGLKNGDVLAADLLVHSNKPDIASAEDLLQIGQKIKIPTQNGVVHIVRSNQTASSIGQDYDVPVADIATLPQNGIADLNTLKIGQELLIPNPKQFARPAPAASGSGGAAAAAQIVRGGQASRSGFIWPASGPISSYFTNSHPLGIDIDFHGSPNQAVGAAAAGTVIFAGGNACCSYGYNVVVDHGNGFETLYAHFSSIAVSVGQKVSQGQVLGYGGRTGYATGNHLHFEVHLNGSYVNPLVYLP